MTRKEATTKETGDVATAGQQRKSAAAGAAAGTAAVPKTLASPSLSSNTKPRAHNLRYRHVTLSSTTDCNGYVTATDWSQTGAWGSHPLTFGDGGKGGTPATAVTPELVRRLRRQDERYVVYDADAVTDLALRSYARPSEWPADEDRVGKTGAGGGGGEDVEARGGRGLDGADGDGGSESGSLLASPSLSSPPTSWSVTIGPYPSIRKLGYVCPLFARKFAPQAAEALTLALADPTIRALGVPRLDLSRAGPAPASPNLSIKTEAWAEEDRGRL